MHLIIYLIDNINKQLRFISYTLINIWILFLNILIIFYKLLLELNFNYRILKKVKKLRYNLQI